MSQPLINKGFKPLSQLSVFLGLAGVSLIIAGIAGYIIARMANIPLTDPQAMLQPQFATALKVMQVVTTLIVFGLPAILFAFICYKNGWAALGLNQGRSMKIGLLAIVIIIATAPLTDALGTLNKAIPLSDSLRAYFDSQEATYETQVKAMLDVGSAKGLLISLLLIAFLPAMVEEFFFRGALQGLLSRWFAKPWVAIVVTAIIFSAIHLSWYGFLPRAMLGVVLGAVFYITGNLWYSVLMHFVNNAAAVIYLYVQQQQGKPMDMTQTTMFPLWAGAISLVVIVSLIWWLAKIHPPKPVTEVMDARIDPFAKSSEPVDLS
jgi:membrane protease YdiL (CAAX protease family)